ncbi:hypothetical protein QE394_000054 [Arthrobacter sp. SORGH_AS 212]|uniref:hypothetical protein n=1 Tax=Pseudarthrobacter sp. SORGH_AS 212 TaxID=3041777 RepID=UPI00278347FD|nr:hypothetical protein [Arthrobacter sp. SORGH_AS_0212]
MNQSAKTITRTAAASLLALTGFAGTTLPAQAATASGPVTEVTQQATGSGSPLLGNILAGGILNGGVINGPVVDGPLVDLGGTGPFQFGQFQ